MIDPEDLVVMTEDEKLNLITQLGETEEWRDCFEPIYCRLMDDDSPKVRQAAVVAMWDLADPKHIDLLMNKVEGDPDVEVRGKAASVLGIYIYEAVVNESLEESKYIAVRRFLMDVARDENEALLVRRMAIEALSFENSEDTQDLIAWAYEHPNKDVKMSAVFAMGRSQNPVWHNAILRELEARDRQLRLEAVNAASEAELSAATPVLRNLATCSDKELRTSALWALAHTRGPGALETIEMCALDKDEDVRRVAEEAIEEYHSLNRPPPNPSGLENDYDDY